MKKEYVFSVCGAKGPHSWDFKSHTITHKHTSSRTHLNDWSTRRRGRYPHNTRQAEETNIYALSGIRTRDPSHQPAQDIRLRPHGQRDWEILVLGKSKFVPKFNESPRHKGVEWSVETTPSIQTSARGGEWSASCPGHSSAQEIASLYSETNLTPEPVRMHRKREKSVASAWNWTQHLLTRFILS